MVLCRVCIVFVHSLAYVMYSVLNTNRADGVNVLNTKRAAGADGKMIETLMLTKGCSKNLGCVVF